MKMRIDSFSDSLNDALLTKYMDATCKSLHSRLAIKLISCVVEILELLNLLVFQIDNNDLLLKGRL